MIEGAGSRYLLDLAEMIVRSGKACGADEIEATVSDGREFSVDVRRGQIENLLEAGSRGLSFRVIKDKKTAQASTSDLNPETVGRLVRNAVKRAALGNPDECAGLPPLSSEKVDASSLRLFDPEVPRLEPAQKIRLALETERIALEDKRITNSHGASFISNEITTVLASSNGFLDSYDQTFCSLSVGLQAGDTDERVEDYWVTVDRFFRNLESPETVAKKALERTVRQLRPRKIRTQTVPLIFEPAMTDWLMGFLFACISAVAVYQKTTFLADKLGQRIGNENVTVVDDALMPGKLGTRPFDSEGVSGRRTTVLERGVLRQFLSDTYAGRKLKLPTTGNSDGGGVGPNNFYLLPGIFSPQEMIASLDKGLLLTRTIGHGLNPVTGDISRGAFGLWVEGGEIAYPVSEVTIAGNLGEILTQIEMVGNDLDFRSPVCGPSIKVGALTVAGE
jgi:PmbA protein